MVRADVLIFAKEMDGLGDRIKAVSNNMRVNLLGIKTVEAAEAEIARLRGCYEEFESCRDALASMSVPPEINEEKKEMLNLFQKQVDGGKMVCDSFAIINRDPKPGENAALVNVEMYQKGIRMQEEAANATVALVQKMIPKLGL